LIRNPRATSKQVADRTNGSPEAIKRYLDATCAMGLTRKVGSVYTIPEYLKPYLEPDSPHYCGGVLSHFRTSTLPIFVHLKRALIEGRPQWGHHYGSESGSTPFDAIYANPEQLKGFLAAMWDLGYDAAVELVRGYSLDCFRCLIDVGGASGSFAIAALRAYPQLEAVVVDLPAVRPHLEFQRKKYGLEKRLTFVGGDFFKDSLPAGDIYVLGYILSDWRMKQGTHLLRKIYSIMPPGGAILILEKLFNETRTGPLSTAMMDIAMLLETWGQHRTAAEYIDWLTEVGFSECITVRSSGEKHMIVGRKGLKPSTSSVRA
jgi:hypothetical protein